MPQSLTRATNLRKSAIIANFIGNQIKRSCIPNPPLVIEVFSVRSKFAIVLDRNFLAERIRPLNDFKRATVAIGNNLDDVERNRSAVQLAPIVLGDRNVSLISREK